MYSNVDHILLTRFNLPTMGFERFMRAKEGWLRERIALFERYCIPSVRSQTSQTFHWVIYFDPESPEWLKQRIQSHAENKLYVPFFRTSVTETELLEDIRTLTGGEQSRLITSNLDNDDALAVDFIERLQKSAPRQGKTAVYLAHGLIKSDHHLYLRLDRTNAFSSVACDWTSPSTCWSDWHTLLGKSMRTLELYDDPAWMQIIHGLNVSNRVRGRLVLPSRFTHLFPGLLDDVRTPATAELAIDVFVARPRRFIRDYGRIIVKNFAIRLLGKESPDKVRIFLSSLRGLSKQEFNEASQWGPE